MNSVSWLLYAANVSSGLQGAAVGFAFLTGAAAASCALFSAVVVSAYPDENDKKNSAWLLRKVRPLALTCIALTALAVLVPSRSTIMLIAASEVGEAVITSTEVQQLGGEAGALATDSLRVLREFINEQLAEPAVAGE
ncbi:MAG TPA: hypothetical protein VN155_16895 [Devosia sp.]|nr:hypothetical protein [Devosia sp.]